MPPCLPASLPPASLPTPSLRTFPARQQQPRAAPLCTPSPVAAPPPDPRETRRPCRSAPQCPRPPPTLPRAGAAPRLAARRCAPGSGQPQGASVWVQLLAQQSSVLQQHQPQRAAFPLPACAPWHRSTLAPLHASAAASHNRVCVGSPVLCYLLLHLALGGLVSFNQVENWGAGEEGRTRRREVSCTVWSGGARRMPAALLARSQHLTNDSLMSSRSSR